MSESRNAALRMLGEAVSLSLSLGKAADDDAAVTNDDTSGDDDEFEPQYHQLCIVLLSLISFLVAVTIIFEKAHEYMMTTVAANMKPVLAQLFDEMMILGFLSIVTYLVESYGILEYVCDKTLGTATDRYEFMKDLLEDVHYTIFFVMFIFIVFVLYLVSFGSWQARQWERMEAAANELVHFEQTDDSHDPAPEEVKTTAEEEAKGEPAVKKGTRLSKAFSKRVSKARKSFVRLRPGSQRATLSGSPSPTPSPGGEEPSRSGSHELSRDQVIRKLSRHAGCSAIQLVEYFAMREEFVRERDLAPPYRPKFLVKFTGPGPSKTDPTDWTDQKKAAKEFPYGYYLGECLAEKFAEVVHVDVQTWLSLELLVIMFVAFMYVVGDKPFLLAHTWILLNVGILCMVIVWWAQTKGLVRNLCSPSDLDHSAGNSQPSSSTPLMGGADTRGASKVQLPIWTTLPNPQLTKRTWLEKRLLGIRPNRMHMLFPFQEFTIDSQLYLCRLFILVQSIYTAILISVMVPGVADATDKGWVGLAYFVVGFLPMVIAVRLLVTLLPMLVFTSYSGPFRSAKQINNVMREDRTRRAVHMLMLLYKIRSQMVSQKGSMKQRGNELEKDESMEETMRKAIAILPLAQYKSLSDAFDLYDVDGGGNIDPRELQALMKSLGNVMTEQESVAMLKTLDQDGDGAVSKTEFIFHFATNHSSHANEDIGEAATELFNMFDDDHSGSLTYSEFEEGLRNLKVHMSQDDLQILMQELDEDRSGRIELDEFVQMMMKHAPAPSDEEHGEEIGLLESATDEEVEINFDGYTLIGAVMGSSAASEEDLPG